MSIHLVSYATTKYRLRQILLSASAKANRVVTTTSSWTPASVASSEFPHLAPEISLAERGSGFWAWKPFIIREALDSIPDGEIVLYCDVGRKYPYILLQHPMDGYVQWMNERGQDIMPGVLIPWNGPMSDWTKRDAFSGTGMDSPEIRSATPIQASFSFWRASSSSRAFVAEWLSWCVQRPLVSDDPSSEPEVAGFRGHRHDQSLLTLCCLKNRIEGINLGNEAPAFNERDPGQTAERCFSTKPSPAFGGTLISLAAKPLQATEKALRSFVTFGKNYE